MGQALSVQGTRARVVSEDHFPDVPAETLRIIGAGGQVRPIDDMQLGA